MRAGPEGSVANLRPGASSPGSAADCDLVWAFHQGDPSAYPEIYRRYRPLVDRVCRRLLCNHADAEEAAQETMLRVLQGLPNFDGTHLKAWVSRIATNICVDVLRSRARRPMNGDAVPLTGNGANRGEDPSEIVERLAEEGRVHALLVRLPQEQRVALVLREFEGLSHRQIAVTLGKSPAQVKALLHRARERFRRAWDEERRSDRGVVGPPVGSLGHLPTAPAPGVGPRPDLPGRGGIGLVSASPAASPAVSMSE
jgi:RNA polymerase sigma-70 factor (ECF subfamily)